MGIVNRSHVIAAVIEIQLKSHGATELVDRLRGQLNLLPGVCLIITDLLSTDDHSTRRLAYVCEDLEDESPVVQSTWIVAALFERLRVFLRSQMKEVPCLVSILCLP